MTLRAEIITKFNHALFFNDNLIGHAVQDVDGFYYFNPSNSTGIWSEYSLRMIADYLEKVNKEWSDKLNDLFMEF